MRYLKLPPPTDSLLTQPWVDNANDSGGDSDISEGPFSRNEVIQQIQALYRKYNPDKLDVLPKLADIGRLYAKRIAKYERAQGHLMNQGFDPRFLQSVSLTARN